MAKINIIEPGSPPAFIAAAIVRHKLIGPGERLGVAVSGGADSVCLLVALTELAGQFGWDLRVLHMNHGLRGAESDADAAFVASLAARLGLPCSVETRVIEQGPDWENRARHARLDFFTGQMRLHSLALVATGHTLDDQAETVLLRLLRGAAPESLRAILPATAGRLIRPMLAVTHEQAVEWLTRQGIDWREDSSNQHVRYSRNWLRSEILPAVEIRFPAARRTLARHAAVALDDAEFWAGAVSDAISGVFQERPDSLIATVDALAILPAALRRRVLRFALARWTAAMSGTAQLEAVMELISGLRRSGKVRLAEAEVWVSMGQVRIGRHSMRPVVDPQQIHTAGVYALPWRGTSLLVERLDQQPATLRSWLPGDRAAWTHSPRRLKELFQQARIPAWDRAGWPVLESGGIVIWAAGLGSNSDVAAEEVPGQSDSPGGSPI